jgi:hypothetical protein
VPKNPQTLSNEFFAELNLLQKVLLDFLAISNVWQLSVDFCTRARSLLSF